MIGSVRVSIFVLFSHFIHLTSCSSPFSQFLFSTTSHKPIEISSTLEVRIDALEITTEKAPSSYELRLCARQQPGDNDGDDDDDDDQQGDTCPLGRSVIAAAKPALLLQQVFTVSSQFSWPETFSLLVKLVAIYHPRQQQQQGSGLLSSPAGSEAETNDADADNEHVSLLRMAINRSGLLPSGNWSFATFTSDNGAASLTLSYRVRCADDLYGPTCTTYCVPRDNLFGHFHCDPVSGNPKCLPGWTAEKSALPCTTAVCQQNCSQEGGFCNKPGECRCREGWTGENCDVCRTKPSCKHGTCMKPGECICDSKWTGENCDKPVNLCATNGARCMENGGQCRNLNDGGYECICPFRRSGHDCDIVTSFCNASPCLNGGTCIDIDEKPGFMCTCSTLATGPTCEQLLTRPVIIAINQQSTTTSKNQPQINIAVIVEESATLSVSTTSTFSSQSALNSTQLVLVVVFGVIGPVAIIMVTGLIFVLRRRRQRQQVVVVPPVCNSVDLPSSIKSHPQLPQNRSWTLFYGETDNLRNLQRKSNLLPRSNNQTRPLSWLTSSSLSQSPDFKSSSTVSVDLNIRNYHPNSTFLQQPSSSSSSCFCHHHPPPLPLPPSFIEDLPPPPYSPSSSAFTSPEDCV